MEKLFEGISKNQEHMVGLIPKVSPLHDVAYPVIEECEALTKQLRILEFAEHLSFLESGVLSARIINDKDILIESIKQYFSFLNTQLSTDPDILPSILEQPQQHKTCLDSLLYLMTDFECLLKKLNFPVIVSEVLEEGGLQTWCDDDLQLFSNDFQALSTFDISHLNILISKPLLIDVCFPMHIILAPMEKRFRYHFCGSQKTNRIDMPEWYMSQVLQWIRTNDYFVTVVDRDFISEKDNTPVSVRLQLMRGLVTLLLDKLHYDLGISAFMPVRFGYQFQMRRSNSEILSCLMDSDPGNSSSSELLENAQNFSHLIDVILQTDAKLTQLAYPNGYPKPSDVLSHPKVFSRWLLLEQCLASDRLKLVLGNFSSWSVVDETEKRPQCVDDFIALLHAVGFRSRQLSDKISRARFVQIQLNLIREFFNDIVLSARRKFENDDSNDLGQSKNKSEVSNAKTTVLGSLFSSRSRSPNASSETKKISIINQLFNCFVDGIGQKLSSRWIIVLNAIKCLHDVMLEWANDQYYVTFWEDLSTRALLQFGDPWLIDIGLCPLVTDEIVKESEQNELKNETFDELHSSNTYLGLHGGVFSQMLRLYNGEIKNMLKETVDLTLTDLKSKSWVYVYATDHWLRTSSVSGYLSSMKSELSNLMMSANASVFFLALRDWLYQLSESLHPKLFTHVWKEIASQLDDYLYNELILSNRFSPLGAAQLRFDLTNYLYPMFSLYTERPESYFFQIRDACVLLNLLRGTAELLRETIMESMNSQQKRDNDPLGPLLELGVYRLTPEEALRILSLRAIPE
ncbi:unnamed protein product [Schistosoma haematobium]|nr:unnamed protein product [Schistosoma haematobium]CAH8674226.1 unnamed protein product [Schistosoma haematobium]